MQLGRLWRNLFFERRLNADTLLSWMVTLGGKDCGVDTVQSLGTAAEKHSLTVMSPSILSLSSDALPSREKESTRRPLQGGEMEPRLRVECLFEILSEG